MYITIMLITLNITVGWVVAGGGHYGGCGYIKTDCPLLIHICV